MSTTIASSVPVPAGITGGASAARTGRSLLRAYVDLGDAGCDAPLHQLELVEARDRRPAEPLPWQIVHARGFRRLLRVQLPGTDVAVDDPAELPRAARTPHWDALVASTGNDAGDDAVRWAATMLFRLGFFRSAAALLDRRGLDGDDGDERWACFLEILAVLARDRAGGTPGAMVAIAARSGAWPPGRLLAYAASIVNAGMGGPSRRARVRDLFDRSTSVVAAVERRDDGLAGLLLQSTFWRGASFAPFLDGDTATTLAWLDRAEELAGAADVEGSRAVARMARYPVLETRARVLRAAGRTGEALAQLEALRAVDPFDQRVLLKLGAAHEAAGDVRGALDAYERSADLGAPFAPYAHLRAAKAASCLGQTGRSRRHSATARRLDPVLAAQSRRRDPSAAPVAPEVTERAAMPWPRVEADGSLAAAIRDVTAARRAAAIARLLPKVAALQGSAVAVSEQLDAIAALERERRSRFLCGGPFSVWWAEMVVAIQQRDADSMSGALLALPALVAAGAAAEPGPPALVRSPRPHLQRFVDSINEAGRDAAGAGDVAIAGDDAAATRFSEMLSLLVRTSPEFVAELAEVVQEVVAFTSATKTAITNASLHGTVFLGLPFDDDGAVLDRFVHECSHVTLNLVLEVDRCHDGPPGATMPSPFRRGARPVQGVLHGVFVFTRASLALARALPELASPEVAARRIRRNLTIISSGVCLLDELGRLTEAADELVHDVRATFRDLVSEYGVDEL